MEKTAKKIWKAVIDRIKRGNNKEKYADITYKLFNEGYEISVFGDVIIKEFPPCNIKILNDSLYGLFKKQCEKSGWKTLTYREEKKWMSYDKEVMVMSMIQLPSKTCKGYKDLMSYINRYGKLKDGGDVKLTPHRLYCRSMSGKYGVLTREWGALNYLDSQEAKCLQYLSDIKANRGKKGRMICHYGIEIYISDYERERAEECCGERRHYLNVEIYDQKGQLKHSTKMF